MRFPSILLAFAIAAAACCLVPAVETHANDNALVLFAISNAFGLDVTSIGGNNGLEHVVNCTEDDDQSQASSVHFLFRIETDCKGVAKISRSVTVDADYNAPEKTLEQFLDNKCCLGGKGTRAPPLPVLQLGEARTQSARYDRDDGWIAISVAAVWGLRFDDLASDRTTMAETVFTLTTDAAHLDEDMTTFRRILLHTRLFQPAYTASLPQERPEARVYVNKVFGLFVPYPEQVIECKDTDPEPHGQDHGFNFRIGPRNEAHCNQRPSRGISSFALYQDADMAPSPEGVLERYGCSDKLERSLAPPDLHWMGAAQYMSGVTKTAASTLALQSSGDINQEERGQIRSRRWKAFSPWERTQPILTRT